MATLTRQDKTEVGTQLTFASAAGGGDVVDNSDGLTSLIIINGSGGDITVTVTAQNTGATNQEYGTLTKADSATVVAAGETWMVGPFRKVPFNNSSRQIAITYSGVTSLTIAAVSSKYPTA